MKPRCSALLNVGLAGGENRESGIWLWLPVAMNMPYGTVAKEQI